MSRLRRIFWKITNYLRYCSSNMQMMSRWRPPDGKHLYSHQRSLQGQRGLWAFAILVTAAFAVAPVSPLGIIPCSAPVEVCGSAVIFVFQFNWPKMNSSTAERIQLLLIYFRSPITAFHSDVNAASMCSCVVSLGPLQFCMRQHANIRNSSYAWSGSDLSED